MIMRRHPALLVLLLALSLLFGGPAHARGGKAYTVAVEPRFTAVDIGRFWTPLLERLSRDTGITLQLRLSKSMADFEAELAAGLPDIVFLNPYHAVMAQETQGYQPFLRGGLPLRGVLVVDESSPVKRLADLNGKRIAFPSPNAFAASLYMRALLKEREGLDFSPYYASTHQNVYRHVMLGEAAAGGGINNTLAREPASVRSRLRVLYTTPPTPSHPLAAHPRVPHHLRETLTAALLRLQSDRQGEQLLAAADLERPMRTDYAGEYAPLESLQLERYVEIARR